MSKEDRFDVAIVGAGPAGIMAAITASEFGSRVILLEKNKELGKKLLLTGNGRCNLTNKEFDLRKLVSNYGKGGEFLFHAFSVFGPKETIDFFEKLGVKTKVEGGNRVFPATDRAVDVLNVLKKCLSSNKVTIFYDSCVSRVILNNKKIEKLVVGDKEITADKYIFCTGGLSYPATGSTGDGFRWAKDLGHQINPPSPALVPLKIKEGWVKDFQGLTLKDVGIVVLNDKKMKERGDVLFTHFGLSGPAILNLSKKVGQLLKNGEVKLLFDLFPSLSLEELIKKINERINDNPKRLLKNFLNDFAPQKLVPIIMSIQDKQVNNISKKEREIIARSLKQIEITVTELLDFELAMVTNGGVSLKEINDKTMQSKIIDNLYFAGEMIDTDGKTGGFNLQACWSTGYLAGKSI